MHPVSQIFGGTLTPQGGGVRFASEGAQVERLVLSFILRKSFSEGQISHPDKINDENHLL